jgi:transposase
MEEDLMARQYTREFKLEALRMAKENGNVTGTARTLGLAQSVLWRWKKEFKKHGPEAFPGHGIPREVTPEDEEVARLRQRIRRLEEENTILKRATDMLRSQERPGREGPSLHKAKRRGSRD